MQLTTDNFFINDNDIYPAFIYHDKPLLNEYTQDRNKLRFRIPVYYPSTNQSW